MVELGLHQAALAQVQRTVGGDQAEAHQVLQSFGDAAAPHTPVVDDEQFVDEFRMVDQVEQDRLHRQRDQVSVGGGALNEFQQVEHVLEGLSHYGPLGRARGERGAFDLGFRRVWQRPHGHDVAVSFSGRG